MNLTIRNRFIHIVSDLLWLKKTFRSYGCKLPSKYDEEKLLSKLIKITSLPFPVIGTDELSVTQPRLDYMSIKYNNMNSSHHCIRLKFYFRNIWHWWLKQASLRSASLSVSMHKMIESLKSWIKNEAENWNIKRINNFRKLRRKINNSQSPEWCIYGWRKIK